MRRLAILSSVLLIPAAAHAAPSHATRPNPATGIINRMVQSLNKQTRVQTQGNIRAGKKVTTSYVLRFQAPDRESITMTAPHSFISSGGTRSSTERFVYVSGRLYTSTDGKHWIKVKGGTPHPTDALGLDSGGALCCNSRGVLPGEMLTYRGITSWHGHRTYMIRYSGDTPATHGTVYIDTHSMLPLHYTVATVLPKHKHSSGSFTLSYGGKFNIVAPK